MNKALWEGQVEIMLSHVFLPVAQVTTTPLGIATLGLLVGILSGMFGVGGGFLLTPMLNVAFGIPYNVSVGSGLVQMVGSSLSGVIGHGKRGKIDLILGVLMILGSLPGIAAGTSLINHWRDLGSVHIGARELPAIQLYMSLLYVVLLFFISVMTSREAFQPRGAGGDREVSGLATRRIGALGVPSMPSLSTSVLHSTSIWIPLSIGCGVGCLSSLMGVGGGFILLPILIYVLRVPTKMAVGTSLLHVFFTSILGSVAHIASRNVDWLLVILLLCGAVAGAQIGTHLSHRMRSVVLRRWFAVLLWFSMFLVLGKLILTLV